MLRWNVALDQRLAVMREYITSTFPLFVSCCSMWQLLDLFFVATVTVVNVPPVSAVTIVITVIYVFTVTAISTVIWSMVSVTEDIM